MRAIHNYRATIFDCDGVLLDSNELKTAGYRRALRDFPHAAVERLMAFHLAHNGVSRRGKFEYFFGEVLGHEQSTQLVEEAVVRYEAAIGDGLRQCNRIPGVGRFLERVEALGLFSAVVSGGEELEVRNVLEHHELARFFDEIYGSPGTKIEHLNRLRNDGHLAGRAVMFGDSHSDFEAAMHHGLDFVMINAASEWEGGADICRLAGHSVVRDFEDLLGRSSR